MEHLIVDNDLVGILENTSDVPEPTRRDEIVTVVPYGDSTRSCTVFTRQGRAFRLMAIAGHYELIPLDVTLRLEKI